MDNINLVVRILPAGDEVDVELPLQTTAKELIEELLESGEVPKADPHGNPYTYDLVVKGTRAHIMPEKTLYDIGIKDGDTLLLMPRLVAGI